VILQVSGEKHNRSATLATGLLRFVPRLTSASSRRSKERKARAERRAAAAWEREHEHGDPEIYEGEILPKISS
jgi:hypothetical protein